MSQTKITIGHVPVNRGAWDENKRYYKDNIVQYLGGSYIANPPGYSVDNPDAYITSKPYESVPSILNTGWSVFADGEQNNSVHINDAQQLSDAQKAQALANVGISGIDDEPVAGSSNLVESGGVANAIKISGIFDVSASTGQTYSSLSAALQDVPSSEQCGGKNIRFVDSTTNQYRQYQLLNSMWSSSEMEWIEEGQLLSIQTKLEKNYTYYGKVVSYHGYLVEGAEYDIVDKYYIENLQSRIFFVTGRLIPAPGAPLIVAMDSQNQFIAGSFYYTSQGTGIDYTKAAIVLPPNTSYVLVHANTLAEHQPLGSELYSLTAIDYAARNEISSLRDEISPIVISAWAGTGSPIFNELPVGSIIYNTTSRLLRKKLSSALWETVPYTKDIYNYLGDLYIWNGTDLELKSTFKQELEKESTKTTAVIQGNGNVLVNPAYTYDVVDKYYTYGGGIFAVVCRQIGSDTNNLSVAAYDKNNIFLKGYYQGIPSPSSSRNLYNVLVDLPQDTYYVKIHGNNNEGGDNFCETKLYALTLVDMSARQAINEEVQAIDEEVNELNDKLIKLVYWGPSGSPIFEELPNGSVVYNTITKLLRRKLDSLLWETVPYLDGSIYTYENNLYIWNGTDLQLVSDNKPDNPFTPEECRLRFYKAVEEKCANLKMSGYVIEGVCGYGRYDDDEVENPVIGHGQSLMPITGMCRVVANSLNYPFLANLWSEKEHIIKAENTDFSYTLTRTLDEHYGEQLEEEYIVLAWKTGTRTNSPAPFYTNLVCAATNYNLQGKVLAGYVHLALNPTLEVEETNRCKAMKILFNIGEALLANRSADISALQTQLIAQQVAHAEVMVYPSYAAFMSNFDASANTDYRLYHYYNDNSPIVNTYSTIKVLASQIVLDYTPDLEEVVTITDNDVYWAPYSGNIFTAGQKFTIRNLLYAYLMISSSQAGVALARTIGGKLLNIYGSEGFLPSS